MFKRKTSLKMSRCTARSKRQTTMAILETTICRQKTRILILFILLLSHRRTSAVYFTRGTPCRGYTPRSLSCEAKAFPTEQQGLLSCARLCARADVCVGVAMDEKGQCYHYQECLSADTCSVDDDPQWLRLPFYGKNLGFAPSALPQEVCLNAGVWNQSTESCQCTGGWIGVNCQMLASKCSQLVGLYPDGYHVVSMKLHRIITVRCQLMSKEPGANTYIALSHGNMSFNRTWEDYVLGFGLPSDQNFWLGLENIHAVTASGLSILSIDIVLDVQMYASSMVRYKNVFVGGPSTKYALDVTWDYDFTTPTFSSAVGESNRLGDCLSKVSQTPFSTFDADHDLNPGDSCASRAGSGWWFTDCDPDCNPLGWSYTARPGPQNPGHLLLKGLDFSDGSSYKNLFAHLDVYFYQRL